ncbi:iron-containing alcohol dehydrogenase [Labrys wisconsinensis]|uniref:Alcohol dehydrogenase class IV n=1 Tax=Labrys wisconsinensis TaxID=425677 RepID=A0ABU0J3V9_9HYPH|nr:iron-containing alcohol dehydrogenase [Labrys wisconsinensis]MDQ0468300.1 alcohol dehydrogenase class IV [Labrys wisconsinensis]
MSLIAYLTTIRFEFGAVSEIGQDLADLGIGRPMIVADAGVAAAGLVDRLRDAAALLRDAPLFDAVPSNPTEEAALAACALYRAERCDGLVAVGGGSPIDLAKAVALLATHSEPLESYAAILGGQPRITAAVAPVVAVPTTAGTGSEVGRAALVTLKDGRKLGFISPHLIPRRAVCDPEMTIGLPPRLTAATGMDAVTHCIETYLSPRDNPPAEAIALDGLARAAAWLPKAVENGTNRHARREMMMAALEGGLTFQKGLGAVHSLSHALGGLKSPSLHHGALNAVLLPAVLRFNESVARPKYAELRRVLGLPAGADLAHWVETLNAQLGLPRTLKEMGTPHEVFSAMAKAAFADHSTATNPRPATEMDFAVLLEEAWD